MEKIRKKLLDFIGSEKDVPLLAGFSVGFYFMVFYYARNFALAYSLLQLAFFTAYYLIMPAAILGIGCWILGKTVWKIYRKHWLFTGIIVFFTGFMLQITSGSFFSLWLLAALAIGALVSIKGNQYYKLFVLLLFFMTLFNVKPIAGIFYRSMGTSNEWKKLPDDIEKVVFRQKPNIYYIQPDGYTSFSNLRENKYYRFDNSDYEAFLKQHGFMLYDDYRSNYNTTLLSNSAAFSMKHHFAQRDVAKYGARGIIIGNNPVLRILKNNGYKTTFISENPYLLMNRPSSAYDYCNISYGEIPFFGDGLAVDKDVFADLKKQMALHQTSGNFYFVEKFLPTHITGREALSAGADAEAKKHMQRLKDAKNWLKQVVGYITAKDPNAMIIIGADHGGYAGFDYTQQSLSKTTDAHLVQSMFGAQLAIRWNNNNASEYDKGLKSSVNLFRSIFSFLSEDKKYLKYQEESSSYAELAEPTGVYRYINDDGKVVFEAAKK